MTTECSQVGFNRKPSGDLFVGASGRQDWYNKIKSDYENRDKICFEMKEWWSKKG